MLLLIRGSRRLRSRWRLSRARLAPRRAPEHVSQTDVPVGAVSQHPRNIDTDTDSGRRTDVSKILNAPARLTPPFARRSARRPTSSPAFALRGLAGRTCHL